MSNQDFQDRLQRLDASGQQASAQANATRPAPKDHGSPLRSGVIGAVCSAVVLALFHNMQTISDMAPDAVKQSETPGLLGLPIALLTVAWFLIIPLKFVRQVVRTSTNRNAPLPTPFTIGAFVALALGLAAMQL